MSRPTADHYGPFSLVSYGTCLTGARYSTPFWTTRSRHPMGCILGSTYLRKLRTIDLSRLTETQIQNHGKDLPSFPPSINFKVQTNKVSSLAGEPPRKNPQNKPWPCKYSLGTHPFTVDGRGNEGELDQSMDHSGETDDQVGEDSKFLTPDLVLPTRAKRTAKELQKNCKRTAADVRGLGVTITKFNPDWVRTPWQTSFAFWVLYSAFNPYSYLFVKSGFLVQV